MEQTNVFASTHPLVAHKLSKLRREDVVPKKFRELIRELSTLLTYEATRDLLVNPVRIQTPLAETDGVELA
ncbi:MAG: uracil phosphoribosyltransferase, partial [Anaerolineales bacterium]